MEWQAICKTKAVKVLGKETSQQVRAAYPNRIISSRMVRRWKPQEGTFAPPKAKSRWCVRGHEDEDTQSLRVYSPTPQSESMMLFLAICAMYDLVLV